jgi:phage terminase large subunit
MAKSLINQIQDQINEYRNRYKIPLRHCLADEDGIGGAVVDNCKIIGFKNNGKPFGKDNYFNLQSQCCYHLAEQINESAIWFAADITEEYKQEIIEELEQLKSYNLDKDGKIRILPKEKVKEQIGRSPDWRDTLMMRSYFDKYQPNKIKVL